MTDSAHEHDAQPTPEELVSAELPSETASDIDLLARVAELERRDDANLCAAAPDLLALLQELVDMEGPLPGTSEWGDRARAAIAAALGHSK